MKCDIHILDAGVFIKILIGLKKTLALVEFPWWQWGMVMPLLNILYILL